MPNGSTRILLVDDEQSIQTLLSYPLRKDGYHVTSALDGNEALRRFEEGRFDLVILDLMLPQMGGVEVCRHLRSRSQVPIIMLTAKGSETDKVAGLEVGADDYITKPFSPKELVARIKAVLRRRAPELAGDAVQIGGLRLDPGAHRIVADGEPVELGPSEFRLLHFLMTHPDRIYSRAQLLDHVWGDHVFIEERTVDVHIRRLRKGLEPSGYDRLIDTVRGSGYGLRKPA